jgi:hypothetical protein
MKKILGGLMVVAGLVAVLLAGTATAELGPPAADPTAMENLRPQQEVSFKAPMTLEKSPLKFRCQTFGNITHHSYVWTIAKSPATEGEGGLRAANVVATGGSGSVEPFEEGSVCHGLPQATKLPEGKYFWQISRPKEPGPGTEYGEVWTFTAGECARCKAVTKNAKRLQRRVDEARKKWRAASGSAKKRAYKTLEGEVDKLSLVDSNRALYCTGGAGHELVPTEPEPN